MKSTEKPMPEPHWVEVEDYKSPEGWTQPAQSVARARSYCAALERGEILFFHRPPFDFSKRDGDFLLSQHWAELRMHKNVSYRPADDVLRGVSGSAPAIERIHSALRNYSTHVIDFVSKFLSPYADQRILDFASFRPFEEDGRDLPLHKRNDLLHVDAFPSRPTRGGRILRVFTNLNPTKPRVWQTTGPFESIAREFAQDAGLPKIAANDSLLTRTVQEWGRKLGVRGMGRTPYDVFMLRFHDFLKENSRFQTSCPKSHLEFPPLATWMVFTDGVAHAVLSGQYALEQTFLIPASTLVAPDQAPYRILENIAGRPLVH
jgi:3-deoxy-D-manno-oct-2-ulosonic acid (Kdo) hydroxylase